MRTRHTRRILHTASMGSIGALLTGCGAGGNQFGLNFSGSWCPPCHVEMRAAYE